MGVALPSRGPGARGGSRSPPRAEGSAALTGRIAPRQLSNRQRRGVLYDAVVRVALPGALVFFSTARTIDPAGGARARVEILRYPRLTAEQRGGIVRFCRAQRGKAFADLGWRNDVLTYVFGLPSRRLDPSAVSCHGLAYHAYAR